MPYLENTVRSTNQDAMTLLYENTVQGSLLLVIIFETVLLLHKKYKSEKSFFFLFHKLSYARPVSQLSLYRSNNYVSFFLDDQNCKLVKKGHHCEEETCTKICVNPATGLNV